MARDKLTPKQRLFVAEYLVDLNATQAAIRAGYSRKTAFSIGVENLKKPLVQNAIHAALKDREKRTQVTQDKVIAEIAKVAFGDMREVMSWGPDGVRLKPSSEIPDDAAAFVAEVSETTTETGGSLKLKTNDKLRALELLGRHFGMFKDKEGPMGGNTNVIITDENSVIYKAVLEEVRRTAKSVRYGAGAPQGEEGADAE